MAESHGRSIQDDDGWTDPNPVSHDVPRVSHGSDGVFSDEEQHVMTGSYSRNRTSAPSRHPAPPRPGRDVTGPPLHLPSLDGDRFPGYYGSQPPRPNEPHHEQNPWATHNTSRQRHHHQPRGISESYNHGPRAPLSRLGFGELDYLPRSQSPGPFSNRPVSPDYFMPSIPAPRFHPSYPSPSPQYHPQNPVQDPLQPRPQPRSQYAPQLRPEYPPYPQYLPPVYPAYPYSQYPQNLLQNNSHPIEADLDLSSSDESSNGDDQDWIYIDNTDSARLSDLGSLTSHMNISGTIQVRSNAKNDDDLLNPYDWKRQLDLVERNVYESYWSRENWPATWRHSDNKTYPKFLKKVRSSFAAVDHLVGQCGLDAILPLIDGHQYQPKRKGTLFEVVEAYKARAVPKTDVAASTLPEPSIPVDSFADWQSTFELVQRLLKARDYLIAVCCDAEFLNEIHPTMDAITWFEQAEAIDDRGSRRIRDQVIELMSISFSHLADVLQSLNEILHALLWGWSEQSTICIRPESERTDPLFMSTDNPIRGFPREGFLESADRPESLSKRYENGERRIQTCLRTLDVGLGTLVNEIEVFAAILSEALLYQCNVHISIPEDPPKEIGVYYGYRKITGLCFQPRALKCMGSLIQGRKIWVLTQIHNPSGHCFYVSPVAVPVPAISYPLPLEASLYMRTTVKDLARIWGPIWTLSELEDEHAWIWYQLPGGYIGAPRKSEAGISIQADEQLCHFSAVEHDFGKCPPRFWIPDSPYLLIGHGLPAALVREESCKIKSETGLEGMALQSIGTLKPFKYRESSTLNLVVGHGGVQAGWSTQIKTNPGILLKESFLQRWKLEPRFRNPRLLLLWYGVEVSLCTRNARRCRIIDLLRSQPVTQYLSTIFWPGANSPAYMNALFEALISEDTMALIRLYDDHPEWHAELGSIIARCLDLLKDSGVNRNGDLAAFAFVKKFHDPEQLAILSKSDHTWIGILKDSTESATFAVVTHQCLEYPAAPGQACRKKNASSQGSKSVLETSYTTTDRSDIARSFRTMKVKDRLILHNSYKFKIRRRSSRGILLGTWHRGFPSYNRSKKRYMERRRDGERFIKVFLVSKKTQRLARLKTSLKPSPSQTGLGDEDIAHRNHRQLSTPVRNTFNSSDSVGNVETPVSSKSTVEDRSSLRGSSSSIGDTSSHTSITIPRLSSKSMDDGNSHGISPRRPNRSDKGTQTTSSTALDEEIASGLFYDEDGASHSRRKDHGSRHGSSSHRKRRHRSSKDREV